MFETVAAAAAAANDDDDDDVGKVLICCDRCVKRRCIRGMQQCFGGRTEREGAALHLK